MLIVINVLAIVEGWWRVTCPKQKKAIKRRTMKRMFYLKAHCYYVSRWILIVLHVLYIYIYRIRLLQLPACLFAWLLLWVLWWLRVVLELRCTFNNLVHKQLLFYCSWIPLIMWLSVGCNDNRHSCCLFVSELPVVCFCSHISTAALSHVVNEQLNKCSEPNIEFEGIMSEYALESMHFTVQTDSCWTAENTCCACFLQIT